MKEVHGTTTVQGSNPFKVPAEDFIISPISGSPKLYINSICNGVINAKEVATIEDTYNKVHGAVPYTEFYVDTDSTYYVKW